MESKTIGQRLREIRKAAGMTQTELAEKIGKARGWANDIESGRINLNVQFVTKWAEVCGYAVEWNFVPLGEEDTEYALKPTKK